MTYKQMLVPYPGLRSPVDNRYDLLVSGAAFLVGMEKYAYFGAGGGWAGPFFSFGF